MKARGCFATVTLTVLASAGLFFALSGVASAQPDLQTLHSFGVDGVAPHGPLFYANDLNFYGTTAGGGGTPAAIFRMTKAGVVTVLHSFSAAGDGASPSGALTQGLDGNLYGTTSAGGAFGKGTAYRIGLDGSGYAVLHSFAGGATDGDTPLAGLYQAVNGDLNFYGTTYAGGTANAGTVFRMTSAGSVSIVHAFSGGFDGANPTAPLIPPVTGTLAGTASSGGTAGLGTIFRIDKFTASAVFSVVHTFVGGANDGANPQGIVYTTQPVPASYYGFTLHGGSSTDAGSGTIYKVDDAGNFTLLHAFAGGADGATPVDAPTPANDGYYYGVTQRGGSTDAGTLFHFHPDPPYAFTTLESFVPGVTGAVPNGLAVTKTDASGGIGNNLYATTQEGGPSAAGVAFAYVGLSKGRLISPTPGAMLGGASVTFTWDTANSVLQYQLEVGTTPGGHELFEGNGVANNNPHQFVSGLPSLGGAVYVRLWTQQSDHSWLYKDYTYTAFDGRQQMTSPSPGSVLSGSSVTFNWTTGLNAVAYWLEVGTGLGQANLFTGGTGSTTHQTVTGLPVSGIPVYVRLWTQYPDLSWNYNDYTYTAATANATMTSPAPGSTLTGTSVTFNWTGATGASQYWLEIGTSVGGGDLFESSVGLALSQAVSGLPSIARPVYVRLWTQRNSTWLFNDYTYTSFNATATMTSPAPGSTLSGASVTFNWSAGSGASQYWLEVGRAAGAGDLFEASVGLATSQAVNGLPVLGTPVYVRLWTLVGSRWLYNDYTYTAFNAKASMTLPAPGSLLSFGNMSFIWAAGTGATSYWLEVGTTPGATNVFGQSVGLATGALVTGIPLTSGTIYVRLWTQLATGWYFTDYTYTTVNAIAAMTSPTPGALLVTSSVTFNWNAVSGATQYWLEIGSAPNDSNLFFTQSTGTSTTINASVPTNGNPIYVRLWTLFGGIWRYADYTYQTIVFP